MTCSYPAVANVIDTPSDYFNIDDWGKGYGSQVAETIAVHNQHISFRVVAYTLIA
jgi:hypothetical protein